jgi:hypothetical protein
MTISLPTLYHVIQPRRAVVQKIPVSNHGIEPFTVRCGASDGILGRTHEGESVNVSPASFAEAHTF